MRFYCHCLNTSIDVLKTDDDEETLTEFVPADLTQSIHESIEWIVADVSTDQAAQTVWPSLLQSKAVREMKVHRCLNCHLFTHVTNIAVNRILINPDLLNEKNLPSVYSDPNYSQITKILLPIAIDHSVGTRLPSAQDEQQQRDCEAVRKLYRVSVEQVEHEIENNIQTYQKEQRGLLAHKTEQMNRELSRFLDLVRSVSRNGSSAKTSPTSSSYINENSTESGFGSDIFEMSAIDSGRTNSMNDRGFSDRMANSDDETNDDPMLDNRDWFSENSNVSSFATSLPRTIALRPVTITSQNPRQTAPIDDLEQIGKSFRDLSRSMCTDGTELFGDLPSPRVNTQYT